MNQKGDVATNIKVENGINKICKSRKPITNLFMSVGRIPSHLMAGTVKYSDSNAKDLDPYLYISMISIPLK